MKKFLGIILAFILVFSNFTGLNSSDAASISSKSKLKKNVTYYADLNGNGKKRKNHD